MLTTLRLLFWLTTTLASVFFFSHMVACELASANNMKSHIWISLFWVILNHMSVINLQCLSSSIDIQLPICDCWLWFLLYTLGRVLSLVSDQWSRAPRSLQAVHVLTCLSSGFLFQVPFSADQRHKSVCSTITTPAWRTEEIAVVLSLVWERRTRGFIASQLGEMCQDRLK